ncbi:hypothetical protein PM082_008623 [Marasmius tenuissimus]|nr:hypothetical protein PM082_008623 [Marasmius tenuissimus]
MSGTILMHKHSKPPVGRNRYESVKETSRSLRTYFRIEKGTQGLCVLLPPMMTTWTGTTQRRLGLYLVIPCYTFPHCAKTRKHWTPEDWKAGTTVR